MKIVDVHKYLGIFLANNGKHTETIKYKVNRAIALIDSLCTS